MTIEQYKQLDNMLLDEINVKKLVYDFAVTEKGTLHLVFNGKDYLFYLGDEPLSDSTQKRMEKFILPLLDNFRKNK